MKTIRRAEGGASGEMKNTKVLKEDKNHLKDKSRLLMSAGVTIQPQILNSDTAIISCTKTNLPFFYGRKKSVEVKKKNLKE